AEFLDAIRSLSQGRRHLEARAKDLFTRCLNDSNPFAREAAVRCYTEVEADREKFFNKIARGLKAENERRAKVQDEEQVKLSDRVSLAMIRALTAKCAGKKSGAIGYALKDLKDLSTNAASQEVRAELSGVIGQFQGGS